MIREPGVDPVIEGPDRDRGDVRSQGSGAEHEIAMEPQRDPPATDPAKRHDVLLTVPQHRVTVIGRDGSERVKSVDVGRGACARPPSEPSS